MDIIVVSSALPIKQPAGRRRKAKYELDRAPQLQQHSVLATPSRLKPNHYRSGLIKQRQLASQRRGGSLRLEQRHQSTVASISRSCNNFNLIARFATGTAIALLLQLTRQSGVEGAERMVRLCIASVDPAKLSSQCVMCNRREFPLTVIDCTGITKVNDLIANPLSVQEATCLIYNCRRQVPDVKPEPYHGSVSHAANYRGAAASNYPLSSPGVAGPTPTGSRVYEMMSPSGTLGGGYSMGAMQPNTMHPHSPYMPRFEPGYGPYMAGGGGGAASMYPPMAAMTPKGLIGGPSILPNRYRGPLPYALVPASSFPFGSSKNKMALMPLFR